MAISRAGNTTLTNAMGRGPRTSWVAGTTTALPQTGLSIDRLTIFAFGADFAAPALAGRQFSAFVARSGAVHRNPTILMTLAGVPDLWSTTLPLSANLTRRAIPCPLAFIDNRLANTVAAHLTTTAFTIVDAGP